MSPLQWFLFAIFTWLYVCCVGQWRTDALPVQARGWDTLPGGSLLSGRVDPNPNTLNYFQDSKWPAYAWDAPANYHQYGKVYGDRWLFPSNVPRWYDQRDGQIFQGTAGYLAPSFYLPGSGVF